MLLTPYFRCLVKNKGSDLFISYDAEPSIKVDGRIKPIKSERLSETLVQQLVYSVMDESRRVAFETNMELDLALSVPGVGRFRVNVYKQRGMPALVARHIKDEIPTIKQLGLPSSLEDLIMEQRGLVLVAGATGNGKSTTLASMVNYRNNTDRGHVLTVEDPIEYWHTNQKCIIDQREVGTDTLSYESALKHALREEPDVIVIGEIRDAGIMQQAVSFADTGHLCLSTIHAHNCVQALQRVINFYPEPARQQLLSDLSINLKAIVVQRLIETIDGQRIPAVEMMLCTPYISELIMNNKIEAIPEVIEKGNSVGCFTLDQSLFELYSDGKITLEAAQKYATSKTNLSMKIRFRDNEMYTQQA